MTFGEDTTYGRKNDIEREITSLRNQLAAARKHLLLIGERKSEYVMETDIPLNLIKEERRHEGMSVEEIAHQTGLAPEEVKRPLETLVRHDVVMEEDGHWQFTVELMRRWVAQK